MSRPAQHLIDESDAEVQEYIAQLKAALRKAVDCIRWNCPNVAVLEELEKALEVETDGNTKL